MLQTTIVAGIAPGAALSGVVVDAQGPHAAYLVSLAAASGLLRRPGRRRHPRRPVTRLAREHLDELVASGDGPPDA